MEQNRQADPLFPSVPRVPEVALMRSATFSEHTKASASPNSTVFAGEEIICLAHEPWHGPWKTYQQILSLIAESNRVLYVGPPASMRQVISGLRTRLNRGPVLERIGASLFVYHEPRFLARANPCRLLGSSFNRGVSLVRLAHVRWLARRLGFRAPILWIFDPTLSHAVGTFREKLVIYYVLDNYVEFVVPTATALRSALARSDERLMRRADIVIAVSQRLQERCLRHNPRSFVVPNGVNFDMFQARLAMGDIPSDMRKISRPIIGYVGVIQPDIDFSLLDRMSVAHPEWSLVFVGPEELGRERPQLSALLARPNVHYLGCKPVADVPAYIGSCDVCIMPDLVDDSTVLDCDSIKLYEYLASGRPIVSTDTPFARRFMGLVRIARDADEFVTHVDQALTEGPHLSDARKAAALENSWRRRVELLNKIIVPCLSPDASILRGAT